VRPARAPVLAPVAVAAFAAAVVGWRVRAERYLVPDEGLGYALGPAGLAMMVLLLLYSLRKRWRLLGSSGPIQAWFHVHMALGILGPLAILFHCNFQLGSLNANVALLCMVVVSTSGLVGRFIYTRIHYEYLGRVATLTELRDEASHDGRLLHALTERVPELGRVLSEFRESALVPRRSLPSRALAFLTLGGRARRARRRAMRAWRASPASRDGSAPSRRQVRGAIRDQVRAIRRVGEYAGYERAFALWHALHLPFCIVLFLAAAVHVVAVHMY
jgi:hypothetical protein